MLVKNIFFLLKIFALNINANKLSYCANRRLNSHNKKLIFERNPCNEKLEFDCKTLQFYMIIEHNNICNNKNYKCYDNIADINESINKFGDYKELISFLIIL